MEKKARTNILQILLQIFVLIVVVLALFFDGKGITLVSGWFTKIFTSLVYSIIAGALIGVFTGNLLEREAFNTKILGINFNIPIAVLTFIVKIWLF